MDQYGKSMNKFLENGIKLRMYILPASSKTEDLKSSLLNPFRAIDKRMLIVTATSIYFLLCEYEFLTTSSTSKKSYRRTEKPMEIQNVFVHFSRCQFHARIQAICVGRT